MCFDVMPYPAMMSSYNGETGQDLRGISRFCEWLVTVKN